MQSSNDHQHIFKFSRQGFMTMSLSEGSTKLFIPFSDSDPVSQIVGRLAHQHPSFDLSSTSVLVNGKTLTADIPLYELNSSQCSSLQFLAVKQNGVAVVATLDRLEEMQTGMDMGMGIGMDMGMEIRNVPKIESEPISAKPTEMDFASINMVLDAWASDGCDQEQSKLTQVQDQSTLLLNDNNNTNQIKKRPSHRDIDFNLNSLFEIPSHSAFNLVVAPEDTESRSLNQSLSETQSQSRDDTSSVTSKKRTFMLTLQPSISDPGISRHQKRVRPKMKALKDMFARKVEELEKENDGLRIERDELNASIQRYTEMLAARLGGISTIMEGLNSDDKEVVKQ